MSPRDEYFFCMKATPEQMDLLWSEGWRHFGIYFFRYQQGYTQGKQCHVMPLRIDLTKFKISKSQKRVLSKNRDLNVIIRSTTINDDDKHQLFYRHRDRFKEHVPDSLNSFLSDYPAVIPCENREIVVYQADRLLAVSFLDIGHSSTSAVYAMFEPDEYKRSLGIFTMLKAIELSLEKGCRYYYPGYAYKESSFYDYKKRFYGMEYLDWDMGWQEFPRELDQQEE